jgi:glycosyltransferase involved in cell wall biosynthesis
MKVLWFSNTPANSSDYLNNEITGGGWLQSLDLAIQDKVELHVAFYYPKKNTSFKFKNTTYHPISSKYWKLKSLKNSIFNSLENENDIIKFIDIINLVKPDVIHIHGTENPFASIISKIKIPVIVSIQGNITVYRHKYFSGIEQKYSEYKPLTFNLFKFVLKKSFFQSYFLLKKMEKRELINLTKTKFVLGRTDWDRRIMKVMTNNATYFHSDEMLRDIFYQNVWNNTSIKSTLVVHSTTGNNFYKGFETICEAAIILKNKNISFQWQIAGLTENDSIVQAVKSKLGKNNFPISEILFLGGLDEKHLVNKLLESNIFVMASHIENSPNNLCEAMILGIPCISTFAGGSSSLLKDKEEGLLIQDGDPWSLAGAIIEMSENYNIALEMGKNARKRALLRHDKTIIVNGLLNIYKTVLVN